MRKYINTDEWESFLDEFRKTESYRKSNGQLLFPKFFEWLSCNYEVPERKKELSISDVSGSLYPTDEQILEMVENFTKDMNVSNTTKKAIQFGFQEGMFQMLEIWKQSNNGR